jgi:hypothetical protein
MSTLRRTPSGHTHRRKLSRNVDNDTDLAVAASLTNATTPIHQPSPSRLPLPSSPLILNSTAMSDMALPFLDTDSQESKSASTSRGGPRCGALVVWLGRVRALPRIGRERLRSVPPRYRWAFFVFWVLWKVVVFCLVVYLVHPSEKGVARPQRLLYTVTSWHDTGFPRTTNGTAFATDTDAAPSFDRFRHRVVPLLVANVQSLTIIKDWDVHVVLITAYPISPSQRSFLSERIPPHVRWTVWDGACPLGYSHDDDRTLRENCHALARQHRYVIKDQLLQHDVFIALDDTVRVTARHVQQYLRLSHELEDWRSAVSGPVLGTDGAVTTTVLSKHQLDRLAPVVIPVQKRGNESRGMPRLRASSDVEPCCNHGNWNPGDELISSRDYVFQQSNLFQPSKLHLFRPAVDPPHNTTTASEGIFVLSNMDTPRLEFMRLSPFPSVPTRSGGWMATQVQLVRWDGDLCLGPLLPPWGETTFPKDGFSLNAEYWLGGFQTLAKIDCPWQRLVDLGHIVDHLWYQIESGYDRGHWTAVADLVRTRKHVL